MRAGVATVLVLVWTVTLTAQISGTIDRRADGSADVKIRNDSNLNLVAFAISVNYTTGEAASKNPHILYVDPAVDSLPTIDKYQRRYAPPLLPNREFTWTPAILLRRNPKEGRPRIEPPLITAGILADGTTTGDELLLNRLLLRRSNMLLAVEMSLELLLDSGRRNVPRQQLVDQFQRMVDSVRRWYLPPEQQIAQGLYQSIIGKLVNLPPQETGAPFPPTAFVERETAELNKQRVVLLESQPSLADIARIGR